MRLLRGILAPHEERRSPHAAFQTNAMDGGRRQVRKKAADAAPSSSSHRGIHAWSERDAEARRSLLELNFRA